MIRIIVVCGLGINDSVSLNLNNDNIDDMREIKN